MYNFLILLEQLQNENEYFQHENARLQNEVTTIRQTSTEEQRAYLCTVNSLRTQINELESQCGEREKKHLQLEERAQMICELELRVSDGEITRRRLHNTLQDLRGNLRVLARVRPILPSDHSSSTNPFVWKEGEDTVVVSNKGKEQRFTFNGSFGAESTHSEIFDEVSNFVQSALDGYNVCLFTYGQTGSGKTFTMQGVEDRDELRGIIPRSIEKIMEDVERLREVGWQYSVQVSFVEIYREQLRDLLTRDANRRGRMDGRMDPRVDHRTDSKMEIKLDAKGHPYIPNVTRLNVETREHIRALMHIASSCRAVGVGLMV